MKNIIVGGIEGGERFAIMAKRNTDNTTYHYALATVKDSSGDIGINYCLSVGEVDYSLSIIRTVGRTINGVLSDTFTEEVGDELLSLLWDKSIEYLLERWKTAGMVNSDLKRLWDDIPKNIETSIRDVGSFLDIEDDGWYNVRVN